MFPPNFQSHHFIFPILVEQIFQLLLTTLATADSGNKIPRLLMQPEH